MSRGAAGKLSTLLAVAIIMIVLISCSQVGAREAKGEPDVPLKVKFKIAEGPSYSQDIQPIFDEYCVSCHGAKRAEAGLRLDSYENTMAGTPSGAVIIPGWPEAGTLGYVLRRPPSQENSMPHGDKKLTPNRIKNIMYWIESGAPNN